MRIAGDDQLGSGCLRECKKLVVFRVDAIGVAQVSFFVFFVRFVFKMLESLLVGIGMPTYLTE